MKTFEVNEEQLNELLHKAVSGGMLTGAGLAVISVILATVLQRLIGIE